MTRATESPTDIYLLLDPRTDEVRYVGKSIRLKTRIRVLLNKARRNPHTYEEFWVRSLLNAGLEPTVVVAQVVPAGEDWQSAEREWISRLREEGARLTNLSDGGDGMPGYRWTEEQRAKLRVPKPPRTPEHSEKIAMWNRGRKHSSEHRRKIGEALKGRPVSNETREKIAAKQRGVSKPPEQVAKVKATRAANPWVAPLDYRQQISRTMRRDELPAVLRGYRGSKNFERDLAIALDTRPQSAIAADHGITQPMVSRIKRAHDAGILRPLEPENRE